MEPRCEHRGEIAISGMTETRPEASMEPRCEHRGESPSSSPSISRPALQWSRGANTAERGWRRGGRPWSCALQWSRGANTAESTQAEYRWDDTETVLQWSRGANTAESGIMSAPGVEGHQASMEPRCEHRGERGEPRGAVAECLASMEPRCEHRGETRERYKGKDGAWASMEPRCEHRGEEFAGDGDANGILASMEPRCEHRGEMLTSELAYLERRLQWSRGANTAESQEVDPLTMCRSRFNGAAVRTPRRARP